VVHGRRCWRARRCTLVAAFESRKRFVLTSNGGRVMDRRTINRILISGTLLASVVIGANVAAQTAIHPTTGGIGQTQTSRTAQNHAAAEQNPACERIINECKNLGFIVGQWKKDNGLWKDCFDPVVKGGGSATRDGKPISVPVSASDVQSCRAAEGHRTVATSAH